MNLNQSFSSGKQFYIGFVLISCRKILPFYDAKYIQESLNSITQMKDVNRKEDFSSKKIEQYTFGD